MWILFAVGSAFFAGATSVLAKAGIKSVSSDFATAFRTGMVLIFSWLMVFVVGCQNAVSTITPRALVFLALSGAATGLSWLCYFKALSIGNLSKLVAVDKSSTFLTILLALIFFHEPFHWLTGLGIAVMIVGTALMLEKGDAKKGERGWLFYAAGSAVFAALQSILGKVGVQDMDSTLATALRTVVVLVFAWAIALVKKEGGDWKKMTRRDAVLLPGAANRPRQRGSAHRQVLHALCRGAVRHLLKREADSPQPIGAGTGGGRHFHDRLGLTGYT